MQLLGPAPTQEIWCGDLHFNKLTWSWEWWLKFENLCVNYSGSSSISALTPTFSHLSDLLFLCLHSLTPDFSFFDFLPMFPRWGLYDLGLDSYAGLLYCQSVLTLRPAQFFCSTDVMCYPSSITFIESLWPTESSQDAIWLPLPFNFSSSSHFCMHIIQPTNPAPCFPFSGFSHDFSHLHWAITHSNFSVLSVL